MKSRGSLRNMDSIRIFQRRFETITLSRFRNRTKIRQASDAIDRIRSKTKDDNKESMTSILRKWRDTRYGPSSS